MSQIKERVQHYIVPRLGTATLAGGTRLYNPTTDADNLALGGFSFFKPVTDSGNPEAITVGTATVANTPEWDLIMLRDQSGDRLPLPQDRKYDRVNQWITGNCRVVAHGTAAATSQNSSRLIGAPAGNVGEVPVFDEEEYILNASQHGWRTDLQFGKTTPIKSGRVTTPDFTNSTLYTVEDQARDWLLHYMAFDFNQQQGIVMSIALCIDSSATAAGFDGAQTAAAIAALPIGTPVVIGYTDNGQPIRLTLDAALKTTFSGLQATLTAAGVPGALIVPYARPTATNLAVPTRAIAGGRTAGNNDSVVDHLYILQLDEAPAYYDEAVQRKERVEVGLDGGFGEATSNLLITSPYNGKGYAAQLKQWYDDIYSHRKYNGGKAWQGHNVDYPSEIVTGAIYDVYVIEYCHKHYLNNGGNVDAPSMLIIGIQNTETEGFTGFTGGVNPHKTYVESFLNSWMPSTQYPHDTISL